MFEVLTIFDLAQNLMPIVFPENTDMYEEYYIVKWLGIFRTRSDNYPIRVIELESPIRVLPGYAPIIMPGMLKMQVGST